MRRANSSRSFSDKALTASIIFSLLIEKILSSQESLAKVDLTLNRTIDLVPVSAYTQTHPVNIEFDLQCQRCAACCRWPGEVRLVGDDARKLAAFLGLSEKDFVERHTRLRNDRTGLALKERDDHSCIFLEGNSCLVHAVKPQQCQEFPNHWANLLWGKVSVE